MALKLPAFDERVDYILAEDRESEVPTVFELRRLTGAEQTQVAALTPVNPRAALEVEAINAAARAERRDLSAEERERVERLIPVDTDFLARRMRQLRLAASLGVVGMRNLLDAGGKPSSMTGSEFAEVGPPSWVAELGEEVMRISQLSEATRKNSSAPPAPGD
ncbi:hypothetical protein [Microcystis phage Mae-JY22]